jgi:tricorn protease
MQFRSALLTTAPKLPLLRRLVAGLAFVLPALTALAQPTGYYRFPALHGDTIVFTAEGDLWKVGVAGGTAQRLTSHPDMEANARISADGATVAFSAQYEGPKDVYAMPLAGGQPRRLTFEGGATVVGWTPDGDVLFSTTILSTLPSEQLVRLNPKTGTRQVLPLAQASDGAFDDAGRTLFFTRLPFQGSSTKRYQGGTTQNLWRFTDGSEAAPLTADFPGTSRNPMPWQGRVYFTSDRDGILNLWSMLPDGTGLQQHTQHKEFDVQSPALDRGRIVYQHGADLRLLDLTSGRDAALPITLATDFDQQRERWVKKPLDFLTSAHLSPDGDRLALTARGQVFVAPVKQGRLVEVPRKAGVRYRNAGFLNSTNLVALSDETGELEFWQLPANGVGTPAQMTREGRIFRHAPVPSPDGKRLAWHDKNQQLWVLNPGDQRPTLITTSLVNPLSDLTWSPDSQWLAYVEKATNTYRQVWLYRPADARKLAVTSDRVDSFSPAWSPDGKWLYFLSDRQLRSLVGSPWGLLQPEPFFTEGTRIYQVALQSGLRSPFQPKDELQSQEPKAPTKRVNTNAPATVKVEIELTGLADRLHELPVPAGNYDELLVLPKTLLIASRGLGFEAKRNLLQLDITNEAPKTKLFAEDIASFELSADGKKLLLRKGETFHVISAEAAAPAKLDEKVDLTAWTFALDPREEWRQIYTESWRMLRDYFYDRDLHGVDWPAIHRKYLPLVSRVSDRAELNDVIAEMAGELSALHTFVRFGDVRQGPDQVQPSFLGARLEREEKSGAWRVAHIYQTDPDYPGAKSPLARPGVDVREGELITAINGRALAAEPQPQELLRLQAGRQVLLSVKSAADAAPRQVIVTPLAAGDEANLRYAEWEYTRRLRVDELGQGRIGYVHLRAMGAENIAEWAREFYPVFQRQGLIIDVRHNRGGNIDSWILEKLLRQAWFYWQPRVGNPSWNMQYAFRGHVVVLCNERTASDGEAFSEGFRRLGLGKVIGTRTWGGEIWLSAQRWLVDSGMASAAEMGVYGPAGEWLIEGHGVDPDIVVDNLPHATFKGEDAQLAAAVTHLLELIAKDPRPVPPTPKHPDKSFKPK